MGDRVRIGELLAAIGTIGLAVTLGLLDWFEGTLVAKDGTPLGSQQLSPVGFDAGILGWFAFAILVVAIVAGLVFVLRVLTGRGPERAMLQAPVAFAFAKIAVLTLLVRLFLFQPGVSVDALSGNKLFLAEEVRRYSADVSLAAGAYLGLLFVVLLALGTWLSMQDERTGSAASKAHTAALLKDVPIRPVPHVPAPAESEASVVADDAVGTAGTDDPTSPSSPGSEGPA